MATKQYYSREEVIDAIFSDDDETPAADFNEPVFYGSDDEIELVEEEIGILDTQSCEIGTSASSPTHTQPASPPTQQQNYIQQT